MSKKLITLFIIFIITFTGFIYTEFFYPKNPAFQIATNNQLPYPPLSEANLSFSPNPLTTTATSSAQINVVMQTNTPANLVQLEIAFDPKVLYNVNIIPSEYFINPEVILYNTDIKSGRISFALKGEPKQISLQPQPVAVITFNTYNYGVQKETNLSFLPKTLVRRDDKEIKLKSVRSAKIIY